MAPGLRLRIKSRQVKQSVLAELNGDSRVSEMNSVLLGTSRSFSACVWSIAFSPKELGHPGMTLEARGRTLHIALNLCEFGTNVSS